MKHKASATLTIVLFASLNTVVWSNPVEWPIAVGGNGHWYEVVYVEGGIRWSDARTDAEARGGYLATLTSPEENNWVFENVVDNPDVWNADYGPWIGAWQDPAYEDPQGDIHDRGWFWVDNTPLGYTNWAPGEPGNNAQYEDFAHFINPTGQPVPANAWNDFQNNPQMISYVLERDIEPFADCNANGISDVCDMSVCPASYILETSQQGLTNGGISILDWQFLGARFTLTHPHRITSVGGHIKGLRENDRSVFIAVVPVSGDQGFPSDPELSEAIFSTVVVAPFNDVGPYPQQVDDTVIGTDFVLYPGTYAIVFGSGLFGATGEAWIPQRGNIQSLPWFFTWNRDVFRNLDEQQMRFLVEGVPIALSDDCNLTKVPDECELAQNDCDKNQVPDDCQYDTDEDGLIDSCDNCLDVANIDQMDFDDDGLGDACDPDIDDDGVLNPDDVCMFTPAGASVDLDGRPLGDIDMDCDSDLDDFKLLQLGFTGTILNPP